MTLALDFEVRHQPVHWDLDIDRLEDPFVVLPTDPDTVSDMSMVQAGLKALDIESVVSGDAVTEAMDLVLYAKNAAILGAKQTALDRLPDLDSPAVRAVGWKWIPRHVLIAWHDRLIADVEQAATPVYVRGAAAAAARIGLQTLAEKGDNECDPHLLAEMAGAVATKYSGSQLLGLHESGKAAPLGRYKGLEPFGPVDHLSL